MWNVIVQLHSGEPELSWSGHTKSNTCHLGRLCTQKEGGYYAAWLSQRDGRTARHDLGLFFSEEELSVSIESTCNMCQWLNLRFLWAEVGLYFQNMPALWPPVFLEARLLNTFLAYFRPIVRYSNSFINGRLCSFTLLYRPTQQRGCWWISL